MVERCSSARFVWAQRVSVIRIHHQVNEVAAFEMWWHTRRNQISSFAQNGRVHLNRAGGVSSVDCWQPEVCASAVVMLDKLWSEVVWRVLATHFISQFPLHFPSRTSPCAIMFQLDCNGVKRLPACKKNGAEVLKMVERTSKIGQMYTSLE